MPNLRVVGEDSRSTVSEYSTNKPTIINIWSSTCPPCLVELSEWATHRRELLAAGVKVITLSTDHLSGAEGTSPATLAALRKTGSSFENLAIAEESLKSLDFLQRSVLDRQLPLPVPSTFLINQNRELVAFYKGPVSARQLLQDLSLARPGLPLDTRRNAAIPFAGRWVGAGAPAQPTRVASLMADHDEPALGAAYLQSCATILESRAREEDSRRELGALYSVAGVLGGLSRETRPQAIRQLARAAELIPADIRIRAELGRQYVMTNQLQKAAAEWSVAAEINPSDLPLLMDLGMLYFRMGNFEQSHRIYTQVVKATPRNGMVLYHLANNEVRMNRLPEAIENYRKTIQRIPNLNQAANNLAWILASHPDERHRSAQEALQITSRLCQQTGEKTPLFLDTHAVALANAGKFEEAIETARKALTLVPLQNEAAIAGIRARIALYQKNLPYRETRWRTQQPRQDDP